MHFKLYDDPDNAFDVFVLNGEFVGVVQEADTEIGYITRREFDWDEPNCKPVPGSDRVVTRHGRVDYLGRHEVDSPDIMLNRLNIIRSQLNLELYKPPLFATIISEDSGGSSLSR